LDERTEARLAKNDSILIDGIIAQRLADGLPSTDKGEAFEYFSLEQILKNYDLSEEEIETGWVDGRHDGGIDGFYIFVNGHLVSDISSFPWPKSHAQVEIFVISCKHHDTFKESTLNSILATVPEIFDLSREDSQLKGAYSKDLLSARKRLLETYKRLAITSPELNLNFVYSSRGDAADIGESVRARSEQIKHAAAAFFSKVNVAFAFLGAKELIELFRETKQFALELPFQDHLAGTGEGYIVVAKLGDYYRFVCDEKGDLRRYLFASNVRDYLGENKVNEDIAVSLENEIVPDFWWLNNGITILTTKAVINGKNMQMQDIQVVNGLQTTETIYRHFNAGSQKSWDGTLSKSLYPRMSDFGIKSFARQTTRAL
jgi:AIPR protein